MNTDLERFDKVEISKKTKKTKNIHRALKSKRKNKKKYGTRAAR